MEMTSNEKVTAKLAHFWSRDFGTELCAKRQLMMTLITTNFQVEPLIVQEI